MRRPSPSMVVSIVAVVLAGAGTSIAAVSFAKNAGAVDGKSAVGHFASNAKAAGKLVATGAQGRIPPRFLDLSGLVRGTVGKFAQGVEVVDNSATGALTLGSGAGAGTLTAVCTDNARATGTEDPEVALTFTNGSGLPLNFSYEVGVRGAEVELLAPGTQTTFVVGGSNTFRVYAQTADVHYVFEGVVRQDGRDTAAAACAVYGYGISL